MFRKGGSAEGGITSGLGRPGYAEDGAVKELTTEEKILQDAVKALISALPPPVLSQYMRYRRYQMNRSLTNRITNLEPWMRADLIHQVFNNFIEHKTLTGWYLRDSVYMMGYMEYTLINGI